MTANVLTEYSEQEDTETLTRRCHSSFAAVGVSAENIFAEGLE